MERQVERQEPEWGGSEWLAGITGMSVSKVNKSRLDGSGPPFAKFGDRVLYHRETARAWLAARQRRSTAEANPATA
jgi:hypothetical protein